MDPRNDQDLPSHQQDFGVMPGINDNPLGASFRTSSPDDATKRGMMWSSIGVGALVLGVGVYFLGDWLRWF